MAELTEKNIEQLVVCFYNKIREDEVLGPIFNDLAQVDWDEHIPLLCQFWNSIMLKTNEYRSNAYAKHVLIGQKMKITEEHFERWLSLFRAEAENILAPEFSKEIIKRASLIAESLKYGMT